jgi:hypothetical protein
MDTTVLGLKNCELNEKVSVLLASPMVWPVKVTGENDGCQTVTVPSAGVPPVPAGTVMVIDVRLAPAAAEVVNPNVYAVPDAPVPASVDDHERLPSVPNALAGRAAIRVLDTATSSAISTMSAVRPRLTGCRSGRLLGWAAHARTIGWITLRKTSACCL